MGDWIGRRGRGTFATHRFNGLLENFDCTKLSIDISKNKCTGTFSFNHLENSFFAWIFYLLYHGLASSRVFHATDGVEKDFLNLRGEDSVVYIPPISCKKNHPSLFCFCFGGGGGNL